MSRIETGIPHPPKDFIQEALKSEAQPPTGRKDDGGSIAVSFDSPQSITQFFADRAKEGEYPHGRKDDSPIDPSFDSGILDPIIR